MNYKKLLMDLVGAKNRADQKDTSVAGEVAKTAGANLLIKLAGWKIILIVAIILFVFLIFLMLAAVVIFNSDDNFSQRTGYLSGIYEECESITVDGQAYSLDDYIAGVVSAEAATTNLEALKAQAVAARTYAIYNSNYCSEPVENSTRFQAFKSEASELATQASKETAGQVLTYEGKLFSSQYDSFCYGDKDCPDAVCDNGTCSVTYTKLPSEEKHTISIPSSYSSRFLSGQGHGRGMSQLMSYYLADEKGYTYDEILEYFYSKGVTISTLTESESSEGFLNGEYATYPIRNAKPTANDKYFNDPYLGNSNRGQCVWYTRGRAMEIIATADGIDEEKRDLAFEAVRGTRGNGKDWWNNPGLKDFNSSSDYTKPKTGSIIVWKWTYNNSSGNNYGHVAIIEEINESEQTITITEGWTNTGSCPNSWSCVVFNSKTMTTDEYYNWVWHRSNDRYQFLGYVYLLD